MNISLKYMYNNYNNNNDDDDDGNVDNPSPAIPITSYSCVSVPRLGARPKRLHSAMTTPGRLS